MLWYYFYCFSSRERVVCEFGALDIDGSSSPSQLAVPNKMDINAYKLSALLLPLTHITHTKGPSFGRMPIFAVFFSWKKKKNKEIEREKPSDFAYFFGRRLQLHVHVMLMLLLFVVCWCKMRNTSKKTLVAFTDVNVIRGGGRCLYALGQRHCSVSKPLDSICS